MRDQLNCLSNLYFNPNVGGNVKRINEYLLGGEFIGLVVLGYLLMVGHWVMGYVQYRQLDLATIVAGVKVEPMKINGVAKMMMCMLGSVTLVAMHYLMLGSYYHFEVSPCMTNPALPAAKWTFSGRPNYYLLLIIAILTAYICILYLSFRQ